MFLQAKSLEVLSVELRGGRAKCPYDPDSNYTIIYVGKRIFCLSFCTRHYFPRVLGWHLLNCRKYVTSYATFESWLHRFVRYGLRWTTQGGVGLTRGRRLGH